MWSDGCRGVCEDTDDDLNSFSGTDFLKKNKSFRKGATFLCLTSDIYEILKLTFTVMPLLLLASLLGTGQYLARQQTHPHAILILRFKLVLENTFLVRSQQILKPTAGLTHTRTHTQNSTHAENYQQFNSYQTNFQSPII